MTISRTQHRFGGMREKSKNERRIRDDRTFNSGMQDKKILWLERDLFILINAVYFDRGMPDEKRKIVLDITRRTATLTRWDQDKYSDLAGCWDQDKNSGEMRD